MSLPISYDDVVAAHARLQGVAHKTPVLTSVITVVSSYYGCCL